MKGVIIVIALLIVVIRYGYALESDRNDTTFISVSSFGSKGNGKADDAAALLKCLDWATQNKGIVVVRIPYGIYLISRSLKFNINDCRQLIIRGQARNGNKPLIISNNFITIFDVYSYYWAPKGSLTISGLAIQGDNVPFSPAHPYFNKPSFCSGIRILNLKYATILNNEIRNIYGNGISIGYSNINLKNLNNRYDRVTIGNNSIVNCWGLHPEKDDYGDGIYTNSMKNALIYNNRIINNLKKTKQFGRAGLVLEYNDENCIVSNNYIFGYDRGIHIESDIGGHIIRNNILEGSDFGILIYDVPAVMNKPIQIISNKISNRGLPFHNGFRRIRNSEERCLLSFFAKEGCRKGSEIIFNQFEIDSGYDYKYSSVARFLASGIIVKDNAFISHLPLPIRKTVNIYLPVDSLVGNTFNNVNVSCTNPEQQHAVRNNKVINEVKTNLKL